MNLIKILGVFILLNLIAVKAFTQTIKNYETDWKAVEKSIEKGLPKTALEQTIKIYNKAKIDKQDAQIIKALVYMNELQMETRENNLVASIAAIEKEIQNTKDPVTALLNSYLAGLYQNLFAENRYKLYNRTNTQNFDKKDPLTWTINDYHKKIGDLYLSSLQNEKLLQETSLVNYDALINKGNVRHLRPTLYDLLAHRALDYFKSSERDIARPAYAFEISEAAAFSPADIFVNEKFTTKDSLSLQHKALLIYQCLLNLHLRDKDKEALIDVDIDRISFVYTNAVHPEKDELYYSALKNIAEKYPTEKTAQQAKYLMAAWHQQQGAVYNAHGDTSNRYQLLKAKEILSTILDQNTMSEGWTNAYNLNNILLQPSFSFQLEKVNLPNAPFRMLLKYKNTGKIHLRIIAATPEIKNALNNKNGEVNYWSILSNAKPIKSWEQKLPANDDLQEHSCEVKIDALPVGEYYVLTSLNKNFDKTKNILAAQLTYISNISYINNGNDFFVLNRSTGQPLNKAKVQAWARQYNYQTYNYTNVKQANYTTDKNGYFQLTNSEVKGYNGNLFEISYQGETLFMDDVAYYYSNTIVEKENKPQTSIFLFTDRSLYRPGQTVYFKGIVISSQKSYKKNEVINDYTTKLHLLNANGEKAGTITCTSNEYGSFNGKFTLPQNSLNGGFTITTENNIGYAHIRVEEYKRPKFYVEIETPKDSYKLNETITVNGVAKAYAGNNIDNASLKYRVVREARFPYPWLFRRGWWPQVATLEIAHGETTTDANGAFSVNFTALPDNKIDKKNEPVFDFKIYVDVTDVNGETRSTESHISVGYKSLLLNTDIHDKMATDSLKMLSVSTTNMAGEFLKSEVTIRIYKLKTENRLLRNRYWEIPDQFVMSKAEYIAHFPNDVYDSEDSPDSWEIQGIVSEQKDSTSKTNLLPLKLFVQTAGWYKIEVTAKDKEGNEVKSVNYTELYDPKKASLVSPSYLFTTKPHPIQPNSSTHILFGSTADNLFVIQNIQKPTTNYSFFKLNNEVKNFAFGATDSDRGGYGVSYAFIKNNRLYQADETIEVPWSNKELQIEYASFRNKTLPGAEEKWTVKISGLQKDKFAAEVLASMYDASLDQFYNHQWSVPSIWYNYYNTTNWNGNNNFLAINSLQEFNVQSEFKEFEKNYDLIFDEHGDPLIFEMNPNIRIRGASSMAKMEDAVSASVEGKVAGVQVVPEAEKAIQNDVIIVGYGKTTKSTMNQTTDAVQIRKNFNETAFFFPDLKTDQEGNVHFSFTMPEALTKWKLQTLAHTKELAFGYSSKETITQRELMVQPNAPRFLREADQLAFSSKLVNLSDKPLKGVATLQLFDATTNEPIDNLFKNHTASQNITIAAGQSVAVVFPITVPNHYSNAVTWRIVAKATTGTDNQLSDGEENILPVLSNRMLVTETMPLNMRGNGTKSFEFTKLLQSATSHTLTNQSLTVEFSSNPAWYAVQALSYLMEYPYECAEQTWNKYYANSLATMIANSSPEIKRVFEKWSTEDTAALLSNLEKNQELKAVLLEETPWVLQAKNETQQKKNIALLFDLVRMSSELNKAYTKLAEMQSVNGGFVWFKGGPDDRYMTQYILTGIGHLKKINAIENGQQNNLNAIIKKAIPYLDLKIKQEFDDLKKYKTDLSKYTPSYTVVQYLYMRSFFPEIKMAAIANDAVTYFKQRATLTWAKQNKYMQGMLALALHRNNDKPTPKAILKSLKESSINNEEMGMYYKDVTRGWWWHEAPIERQALLIEAFEEINKDTKTADDLRTWLLKNKQTNSWESTKATAEACYALLLKGTEWLSAAPDVTIDLGGLKIESQLEKTEAGTGYFKKAISGDKVKPQMGNMKLSVSQSGNGSNLPTWGGVYWQYFENLDKITSAATPLKLEKKLFLETNTDTGPVLSPVTNNTIIKLGDKVKVRIELRVDRDMEYVHLKDMRATAFEPVNVLSSFKWQGGLGYYETTKDASTNFFFGYLGKGTYIFEYSVFATVAGNFSNGITSIQCMYAPEFSAHSEGVRVTVK